MQRDVSPRSVFEMECIQCEQCGIVKSQSNLIVHSV